MAFPRSQWTIPAREDADRTARVRHRRPVWQRATPPVTIPGRPDRIGSHRPSPKGPHRERRLDRRPDEAHRRFGHPQGVRHGPGHEGPDQPVDRPARLRRRGPVKLAAIDAIEGGFNAYTVTQGIPELRGKIQGAVDAEFHHEDRQVLITSGTSGALLLALSCVVDPGDEVIIFDPYFVMYRHLVTLAGGTSVLVDTYPDFRVDLGRVAAAMTPKTKCVIVNSPANPTGTVASAEEIRGLAQALPRARRPADQRRGLPGLLASTAPARPRRPGMRTSWSSTASPRPTG